MLRRFCNFRYGFQNTFSVTVLDIRDDSRITSLFLSAIITAERDGYFEFAEVVFAASLSLLHLGWRAVVWGFAA
jgi:hypothetical protein